MEQKNLTKQFESLPAEAKNQLLMFLEFLKEKYVLMEKTKRNNNSILNSEFVGLWKDREEFNDSNIWLRERRKKEWEG